MRWTVFNVHFVSCCALFFGATAGALGTRYLDWIDDFSSRFYRI